MYTIVFNFSPVTPIFDIPTTESAVQRATSIYQRRRKKLLEGQANALARGSFTTNNSKVNQQKKLTRKFLGPKETLIPNEYRMENIEKIRGEPYRLYEECALVDPRLCSLVYFEL